MNWLFSLPIIFLLLIILFYFISRKREGFYEIRKLIPQLFSLLFLTLLISFLNINFISDIFYSDKLISILWLIILLFILNVSIKIIVFFLFDFMLYTKEGITRIRLIKDIITIILYIIGILLIFNYFLNIKITVILASSAVLTVVIGFALQDTLGDLFSGISLNFEESLKIGDWIRIGEYEGEIEQFRWRSIKIRTIDNILILIPNQIVSKKEVLNFGHLNSNIALRLKIGVSYKNSPDFVIKTIQETLKLINPVLKKPAPMVMVSDFNDFSIEYDIKFWINDYSKKDIINNEIRRKIWYAFKRNNIEIPFPIRNIYIKKEIEHEVNKEYIFNSLKKDEIFSSIDEKYLKQLIQEHSEINLYGKGETLIKEGEKGEYFYYIIDGEVEVLKNDKVINILKNSDCFGEMSLFTGEKTSASIRTSKESKILKLSSDKFRETVKINEKMAKKLSEVIALRRSKLKELSIIESEFSQTSIKKESENIFKRIKKYFRI